MVDDLIADIKDNKRLEFSVYPDAGGELAFKSFEDTGENASATVICQDVKRPVPDGKS